jgi:hypothetical protein
MYAEFAEAAFREESTVFGEWPETTTILLDGSSDVANGFATSIPYPLIAAYPVLPSTYDPITDFGNWGAELITHEYAHILTFEPANGVVRPFRLVFGSIVRPNVLLPRWYLEGLAVWMETHHSHFGRLRSKNFLAIARAMTEDGNLHDEDISRINEVSIPDFPGGNRPYLMGSLMWDEITARAGNETIIGDLNQSYSRRVPFLINAPIEARLGVDYETLLGQMYDRVTASAQKQIDSVKAVGTTPFSALDVGGFVQRSPRLSPDGRWLAVVTYDHNIDGAITIVARETTAVDGVSAHTPGLASGVAASATQLKKLIRARGTKGFAWLSDSRGVIFDRISDSSRYNQYSDLWRAEWRTPSGASSGASLVASSLANDSHIEITQLTHGLRAQEPTLSADGQTVVFVQNTTASTRLAQVDAANGANYKILYEPPPQTRIANPDFISPTKIVWSERGTDGHEVLKTLDLAQAGAAAQPSAMPTSAATMILPSFASARFPHMTKNGFLFTSDKTGISNIYQANQDFTDARAITNLTAGALDSDFDFNTGSVLVTRLTGHGPRVAEIHASDWQKSATPPDVAPLIAEPRENSGAAAAGTATAVTASGTTGSAQDYNPWPYLMPRYWLPYMYFLPGGTYVQASTDSADPTGRHSYALTAAYDTLSRKPSLFGEYTNATQPVAVTLLGEDLNEYLYSFEIVRHTSEAAVNGGFYLPSLSNHWRGNISWQYLQTDVQGIETLVRNGARVGVAFNNAEQRGEEVSPEHGGSLAVSEAHYFPNFGNVDYDQTDIATALYFSDWLPRRHSIAFYTHSSIAPQLHQTLLGQTTSGGAYQAGLLDQSFIVRGYASGTFIGRNLITSTLEYHFPLTYTYHGSGTTPFFLSRIHADLFIDALTLDGYWYDWVDQTFTTAKLGHFFYGVGAEIKADATIFYQIPIQFIFGLYRGLDDRANPNGVFPFFGFGI